MMRLLAYNGQAGAAVRQYQECLRVLDEELGLSPSPETTELYEAIQSQQLTAPRKTTGVASSLEKELSPEPGEPPFKGLTYYDVDDAHLFFGREELAAKLAVRLKQSSFLAVVGASGSGKSSLVRAGLLPALRSGQILADEAIYDGLSLPRDSQTWPVYLMTPTARPLKALALSLTREAESARATTLLMDDLAQEPRSLDIHVEKLLADSPAQSVLLVIDQFEELFTQCRDEAERQAFIDNLLAAVTANQDGATTIVITLRADFYAHCARYDGLRELLENQQAYIGQMTAGELRQAIQGPAKAEDWTFEPGLIDLLLHDVGTGRNRKPEPGALPLLSHALLETWRRRRGRQMTFSGYAETGGVRRAIARTAEAVYNDELTAEQRPIARSLFLRLTELGEGAQDTRRRATLAELIPRPEEAPAVEAVLKTLADARLITTGEDEVEVAHEALIREWPRLGDWLAEDREGLRLHRQLTEAAQVWQTLEQDEGALYRGAQLAQAREWAESHGGELNPLERDFLEASQELASRDEAERETQRQRELEAARNLAASEKRRAEEQTRAAEQLRRRRRYLQGALALAVVLALAALFFGYQALNERNLAQERARLAQLALASQLGLQAQDDLANLSQRSLLLAVESLQVTTAIGEPPSAGAEQALRQALAQVGGKVLPDPSEPVRGAVFSPDGRWLAIYSEPIGGETTNKHILWLWDLGIIDPQSHRFEATTPAFTTSDVRFSSGGRWLAWASGGLIRLWDLAGANAADEFLVLGEHSLVSRVITFDPNGLWLAAIIHPGFSPNHILMLWDLSNSEPAAAPIQLPGQSGIPNEILIDPGGRWLVTSGSADDLDANAIEVRELPRLWKLTPEGPAPNPIILDGLRELINTSSLSFDGRWLAAGDQGNSVYLWELASPEPAENLLTLRLEDPAAADDGLATGVSWQAFSHDSQHLFARLGSGVWRWDLTEEGLADQPDIFRANGEIVDTNISSNDRWLVTVDDLGEALLWDLWSTNPTNHSDRLNNDDLAVVQARFSNDGRWLAAQVRGNVAQLWDFSDPDRIIGPITLGGHEATVTEATLSPDGHRLLTADEENMVRLWDLENLQTGVDPIAISAHEEEISALATSPDGIRLASGSADGEIRLWEMDGQIPPGQSLALAGHESGIRGLAFNSDSRQLVSGGEDGTLRLWDLESAEPEAILLGRSELGISALAISPDDKWLVAADSDGGMWRWDLTKPGESIMLPGHEGGINALAISPDGRWLASGGTDDTARLWDLTADPPGTNQTVLSGHIQDVMTVAFTPDGNRLITGSLDKHARIWDLTAEDPDAEPIVLEGHSDLINALAISPDGKHLVTAGDTFLGNTAHLWDLTAGDPAAEPILLPEQESEAKALAITADSRWLVLGGEDGRLRFWRLKIDDLMESACQVVGRNLSLDEWELFFPGDAYRQTCPGWPLAEGVTAAENTTK
jgi:WD40 repeat protein